MCVLAPEFQLLVTLGLGGVGGKDGVDAPQKGTSLYRASTRRRQGVGRHGVWRRRLRSGRTSGGFVVWVFVRLAYLATRQGSSFLFWSAAVGTHERLALYWYSLAASCMIDYSKAEVGDGEGREAAASQRLPDGNKTGPGQRKGGYELFLYVVFNLAPVCLPVSV